MPPYGAIGSNTAVRVRSAVGVRVRVWSVDSTEPVQRTKRQPSAGTAVRIRGTPVTQAPVQGAGGFACGKLFACGEPDGRVPSLRDSVEGRSACGEADGMIYESYLKFRRHCEEIGLEAHWFSRPGYGHEWRFWDLAIQEALDFFGL